MQHTHSKTLKQQFVTLVEARKYRLARVVLVQIRRDATEMLQLAEADLMESMLNQLEEEIVCVG